MNVGPFYKMDSANFVPVTRTPWGGRLIPSIKQKYLGAQARWPERIGETWEVSTDAQFPSNVALDESQTKPLAHLLESFPKDLLGPSLSEKYGSHCPLLLKWLHAQDLLSVQVHPNNLNPNLRPSECGKPESWLVMDVEPGGYVYLGFQDGLTPSEIVDLLEADRPDACLHKYFPKKYDYISVPTGCIHATGPGVLIAEPQYVLPGRSGKTWRISDWRRRYDEQGNLSADGKARELHTKDGLHALDWSLPRGRELEKSLIRPMTHTERFAGNGLNPFALQLFCEPGSYAYSQLVKNHFSLLTVWSGQVILSDQASGKSLRLVGGESAMIAASSQKLSVTLEPFCGENPGAGFFALRTDVVADNGVFERTNK